jgi:hypothetical protein
VISGFRRGTKRLRSTGKVRNRRFGTTYSCKQFKKNFFENRFTLEDVVPKRQ